ncbi:anti-sigma factor [Lyngbya sp. CCY1209]|jgi:anti-sigma factor RsiW|uniref:anti-sigma factor family protein n=1 Tax=Lyngbya sp. CCY1209 TaxID=2886103 RepID=UPI002D20A25B|nr:anti-sigma factor [Lyngbya sp. CCY1209]MEB3884653.1 zf-HC2 domain-containing protein [Lyngbya sp. CCY1209]
MHFNSDDRDRNLNPQHPLDPKEFERLSAYFDGEATPEERRQIEARLDSDRQFKATYHELRKLRSQLQGMPIQATGPLEDIAREVFRRIDRRTHLMWAGSGGAIAALFLMLVSGQFPRPLMANGWDTKPEPVRIALNEPLVPIVNPEAASITVNRPIIQIPKAAISDP